MGMFIRAGVGALLFTAIALHAQTVVPVPASPEADVPVFPASIVDRPYKVLGEVKIKSQTDVARELWTRAKKMGADAVITADFGDRSGAAVKFTAPAPDGR